jgi:hypothetical protein
MSHVIRDASKKSDALLHASGANPCAEKLVVNAYRAFRFDEGQRAKARVVTKAIPKMSRS